MQQVLSVYNEYLLYTTNTYSIQQVCTLQHVLFYIARTYTMQPVLTQFNAYLHYATSTYSTQQVLTLCNMYLRYTTKELTLCTK